MNLFLEIFCYGLLGIVLLYLGVRVAGAAWFLSKKEYWVSIYKSKEKERKDT